MRARDIHIVFTRSGHVVLAMPLAADGSARGDSEIGRSDPCDGIGMSLSIPLDNGAGEILMTTMPKSCDHQLVSRAQ